MHAQHTPADRAGAARRRHAALAARIFLAGALLAVTAGPAVAAPFEPNGPAIAAADFPPGPYIAAGASGAGGLPDLNVAVWGGAGSDAIWGGAGSDAIWGGAGSE